ncbi:hypothetical protein MG293_005782 [Ovis ammon polii]|uniref:Uncharacterized protein n=1 Tax=Ovis ammon polii TaxID=230172 RepID=A0AAD4YG94_OVIAM|nr:hypothetical protein MG293_005782 [Ovis ammon polii]
MTLLLSTKMSGKALSNPPTVAVRWGPRKEMDAGKNSHKAVPHKGSQPLGCRRTCWRAGGLAGREEGERTKREQGKKPSSLALTSVKPTKASVSDTHSHLLPDSFPVTFTLPPSHNGRSQ